MKRFLLAQLIFLICANTLSVAQDNQRESATGVAPAGYGVLEHVSTGVVYADQTLLTRYRELLTRVQQLRKQILDGVPSSQDAKNELAKLRDELTILRELIDEQKVIVEPYRSFKRTDQQDIPLSDSQRIIITADSVRVEGWDGEGIRCLIEQVILSEVEPDASEFANIKVVHEVRVADDWVGMTDEQRAADQQRFLDSEAGKKLSDEAKANRAKIVDDIHNSYKMYRGFQGKEVNTILVEGLTGQQGNRMIEGKTQSPGGAATVGGYWKRFAELTVLVPDCKQLAIRGCQKMISIKDVHADLVLTTHDSHDSDYGGTFVIDNVHGNIVVHQAPIRSITNVKGNLDVLQTDEFCDRSTSHENGFRTITPADTASTVFSDISGDVKARILRTDLQLRGVAGTVDIENEHGDTRWFIDDPAKGAAHRVFSASGAIEFITPHAESAGLPVYAYTQAGIARTSFSQQEFDDRSFSTAGRGWHGFNTAGATRDLFLAFRRHALALENASRESGIDLISDAGSVIIDKKPTQD